MNHWKISRAARHLEAGGIVAYPTEGVYGLGCNPFDAQAVLRLLTIKQRPISMGLIVIASQLEQLNSLLAPLSKKLAAPAKSSWPGPVTWIWPCRPEVPEWLTGTHTSLAVRVTAHPLAAALCKAFDGPIISTSANLHGELPARSALAVQRMFGDQIDCILHGELSGLANTTEIRDVMSGRLLRKP